MLASRPAICGLNWVRVKTRLQHKSALQTPKDGGGEAVVPAQAEIQVYLPTAAMTRANGMHRTGFPPARE